MMNKPPGLPFTAVVSVVAVVILVYTSDPYWYFEMFLLGIPVCFLLFVYWGLRTLWAEHKGTLPGGVLNRTIAPWYIAIAVMLALITDAPFWIRFTISEPSMRAYAEAVTENPDRAEEAPCQWAGLYYVCGSWQYTDLRTGEVVPGSAGFTVKAWAVQENKGFLWLPTGEPEETFDDRYRYLKAHWYGYEGWDSW